MVAVALTGCVAPGPTKPAVTITRADPRVTYHTFAAGRPPPHPSYIPSLELGLCATRFPVYVEVGVEYPKFGYSTVEATVTSVSVLTQLNIEIWSAEGKEAHVLPHEETHRAISEHYYRDAETLARRFAQKLMGRKVAFSPRETRESLRDALEPLQREIVDAYLRETQKRCNFAQEQFDGITDHGRNTIANDVAMAQAIAAEENHWKQNSSAGVESLTATR